MQSESAKPDSQEIFASAAFIDGRVQPARISIKNGMITAVQTGANASQVVSVAHDNQESIELSGGVLSPGFIDLQINGFGGADFAQSTPEQWHAARQSLAKRGVTAVMPTVTSDEPSSQLRNVAAAAKINAQLNSGARILGYHLEGPFISEQFRGAHPTEKLRLPQGFNHSALVHDVNVKLVTLAPELPGALPLIKALKAAGKIVSIGHSAASAEEAKLAAEAGATMVTHLYNAQTSLNHREPGVVGTALTDERLTCGLILDGIHVSAAAAKIAFASAPNRIALVSDAVAAAGMNVGSYKLGLDEIDVLADGSVRRPDGALAGSSKTLDQALAFGLAAGIPLVELLKGMTTTPASLIGNGSIGSIRVGADADLVWLQDPTSEQSNRRVWLAGAEVT